MVIRDGAGGQVEPISSYLRDLVLGDVSPPTCRSYAFDLLWWFRALWAVDIGWEQATEAAALVRPAAVGVQPAARQRPRRERGKGLVLAPRRGVMLRR